MLVSGSPILCTLMSVINVEVVKVTRKKFVKSKCMEMFALMIGIFSLFLLKTFTEQSSPNLIDPRITSSFSGEPIPCNVLITGEHYKAECS